MKPLLNEKVLHNKYGTGTIIDENPKRITVKFEHVKEEKLFFVPICFEKYLSLENEDLQKEYSKLAVESRLVHEKEVNERKTELLKMEELQKKELIAKKKKRVTKTK